MMPCTRCIENMDNCEETIEEYNCCLPNDGDSTSIYNAEVHSGSVDNAYCINKCSRCRVVTGVIFLGCLIATGLITNFVTRNSLSTSRNSNGPECLPTLSRLTGQPQKDRPDGLRQEGPKCKDSNCQTCALDMHAHDVCSLSAQKWNEHFVKCRYDDTTYCLQCGDKNFNSTSLLLEENWRYGDLTCSKTLSIAKESKCCLLRNLGNKNGDCKNGGKRVCDKNGTAHCTNPPQIMCNCHRNIPLVEEDTLNVCNETTYHHSEEPHCKQRIDKGAGNYEACYCYNNKEKVPAPNLQKCIDLKR